MREADTCGWRTTTADPRANLRLFRRAGLRANGAADGRAMYAAGQRFTPDAIIST